jgi:signal transduction histidine kinase
VVFDYLFVPPIHSLALPGSRNAFALAVYLITAVVTGVLAARLQKAARAAACLSDEQAALRRVATLVARAVPPEEVFVAVTSEIGQVLSAEFTSMSRYDGDGTATAVGTWSRTGVPSLLTVGDRMSLGGRNLNTLVFQTARPARIDDYDNSSGEPGRVARGLGLRSAVGVPISVQGRLWGIVTVGYAGTAVAPAGTEQRLADFTELVATAIANAQAQAELTASRARIVAAGDQARRRIERDLHDGAQQRLITLAMMLGDIRDTVPVDVRADVDEATEELAAARRELRDLCHGVGPAIRALARRSPLRVKVNLAIRTDGRMPDQVEVSAYYVVAEALTNAATHAHASAVTVEAEIDGGVLRLAVRDDGAGGADFDGGTGLTGLKDRVEAIGGRIFLDSPPGAGTSLRAELPLTPAAGGVTSAAGPAGQVPAELR